MSLTTKVLIGLAAGLALGILVSALGVPALVGAVGWIEPIGTLWVNALRMTIVPLVATGLITAAASGSDARVLGRLGGRAMGWFLALLAFAALVTVVLAPPVFALLPLDDAAVQALRADAGGLTAAAGADTASGFPDLRAWVVALVPTNAIAAAADGRILPLIVFSLALGFAITRVGTAERETLVRFFRGFFEATMVLVRWILALAPIGVFALALPLATRLGLAAAGAVAYYIGAAAFLLLVLLAALYPIAAIFGRVSPVRFARGCAEAQAVAIPSRSSLAALPAMIDGGEKHLGFPLEVKNFLLPLSASMFRYGSAVGIPAGVLFIARLYGVELGFGELLTVAVTSALVTFSIPAVPGGSILIMVPVLLSVGLPPEGIGILLGVDAIPDMFRTVTNVTGTMTVATIVSRDQATSPVGSQVPSSPPQPAPVP